MAIADVEPPRPAWPIAATAGAIAMIVYLRTLLPGIAFGDWGEMQTVPHVLGIAHPTGYPTYVLLAWLAELLPVGPVAFRANLLSAILVSATIATVAVIGLHLGARPLIATTCALILGIVGTVWAAATVAEVNPLHLLFAALLLHRALVWSERRFVRDLVIGGLLLGLALGNHLLTLFLAPSIGAFVLWAGRREILARPWIVLAGLAAATLGLTVYVYIPLAAAQSPPLAYNHPTNLDSFLWLVEGTQFRTQFDFLSLRGPGEFVASLPTLWSILASRATPLVPILGVFGLAVLLRRRLAFGLLGIAFLLTGIYIWANYLHLEHYLLVPWLVLGIGIMVALDSIATEALHWSGQITGVNGARAVAVVGAAFAIGLAASNWRSADRSGDHTGQDYVDAVFAALPPDAAILAYWDASTPLWHGQLVQGMRSDVLIVDDTNIVYEGWVTRERRIESLICERPVFILRLADADLRPTRDEFQLEPFIAVRTAAGGSSAAVERPIYRVEPLGSGACPT
jgi:Protein of unknown function (DUF2723)